MCNSHISTVKGTESKSPSVRYFKAEHEVRKCFRFLAAVDPGL